MTTCSLCERKYQDCEIEQEEGQVSVCWKCAQRPDCNERITEVSEALEYAREREETDRSLTHWGKGIS